MSMLLELLRLVPFKRRITVFLQHRLATGTYLHHIGTGTTSGLNVRPRYWLMLRQRRRRLLWAPVRAALVQAPHLDITQTHTRLCCVHTNRQQPRPHLCAGHHTGPVIKHWRPPFLVNKRRKPRPMLPPHPETCRRKQPQPLTGCQPKRVYSTDT